MTRDKLFIRWVIMLPVFNILMDIGMNFLPSLEGSDRLVKNHFPDWANLILFNELQAK